MLLWVGRQFDPTRPGLLRRYPPVVSEYARPVTGFITQSMLEGFLGLDNITRDLARPASG